MKYLITFVIILVSFHFPIKTIAQNLPNYDFENWTSNGTFNNPVSWGTSNFSVFSVITFNTVTEEKTKVYSGTSSVRLVTIEKNVTGDPIKVVGLITLGIFDINISTRKAFVKGGIAFDGRPTKLSGYYQYTTPSTDSCIMSIYLTKFNTSTNKSDTIGLGIFKSGINNDWTYFEAPVEYNSNYNPDTMNIIVMSSDTSLFVPGSTLYIDKLSIDATLPANSLPLENKIFSVFPNPAKDQITISLNNLQNQEINYSIINTSGSIIRNSSIYDTYESIDISGYQSGIYTIVIWSDTRRYYQRFVVN